MIQVRECEGGACLFENYRCFGPVFPDAENAQEFIDASRVARTDGYEDILRRADEWIREHQEEETHADH